MVKYHKNYNLIELIFNYQNTSTIMAPKKYITIFLFHINWNKLDSQINELKHQDNYMELES